MKKYIIPLLVIGLSFVGCEKYLDLKPDVKMVVPKTLDDADLLLNDFNTLNNNYSVFGEFSADDYYLHDDVYESISDFDMRNAYIWADLPYTNAMYWQDSYKTVYVANQVLDILSKVDREINPEKYCRSLGAAHFFRAFAFQQLVDVYCLAYNKNTANMDMGIPLRLTSGIDEVSVRTSMQQNYNQIITDYEIALTNLIVNEPNLGRPNKAAAHAGLARVYLNMGDFELAYYHAEEGLKLNHKLLNFNDLNAELAFPIPEFNDEVLFAASFSSAYPMSSEMGFVDSSLIKTYSPSDLRLNVFFRKNDDPIGTYGFRGNYSNNLITFFMGFTTAEVYLIKAEAAARIGKENEARIAINTLLKSRWNKDAAYQEIVEVDAEPLLRIILNERRKELVFRGRRWADLKRLNLDPRFQTTLRRVIKGVEYKLMPNSLLYAYRIPETVVELAKIPQNKR